MSKLNKIAESKVTNSNLCNIPQAVRWILDLKPGDYLEWYTADAKLGVPHFKVIAKGKGAEKRL